MNPYNYLKTHAFYIILILVGLVAFRSWLQEHDARLQSLQDVKLAEVTVQSLQAQIKATDAAASRAQATLAAKVKAVKTPAQAIAAIPDVSTLPLNTRPVPGDPTAVQVDVLPLFQELAACRSDAIALTACTKDLESEKGIVTQKEVEITALKAKPRFWSRVKHELKTAVTGAVVFEVVKVVLTKRI